MPGVGAAVMAIGGAAVAAAPAIGAAVGVYSVVEGRRQAKAAESAADQYAQAEWESREREAGEYFDLTQKQMELQAQSSNIKTLATLIERESQPPRRQVITLPPATPYNALEQINIAIGKLFAA